MRYKTAEDRKKQLKDFCFKCLKVGHTSRDCKSSKVCVHCESEMIITEVCVQRNFPEDATWSMFS